MHAAQCNLCKWMVTLVAALLLMGTVRAEEAPAEPPVCEAGAYRAFDFWVGSWTVAGAQGQQAGRNVISREQEGCVLVERWQGVQGSTGMSMNHYDPVADRWHQLWVSPGVQIDIAGSLRDGSMVLEGTIIYLREGRQRAFRGTWTPLEDGRVRQFFEERDDAGQWAEWFEGFYTRADV